MISESMRCPSCGFTQLARSNCKSCGRPIAGKADSTVSMEPLRPVASSSSGVQTSPEPDMETASPESTLGEDEASVGDDAQPQSRRLIFTGTGGTLFGIHIINMFLTLLTLGLYSFWAKVRVRRYLFSQTAFEGDRFAYHGTGKELFFGFLKAAVVFGGASALFNLAPMMPGGMYAQGAVLILAYVMLLLFIPVALVGARRYRLSRTSWRGIRFSFRGPIKDFIKLFLAGLGLNLVTLGLYYPFFQTKIYGFMTSHAYFGNHKFSFGGTGKDLFGSYVLTLLLTLPTFGLCWFWYQAKKKRYFWNHTSFGSAQFQSTVTGGRLLWLHLGNAFLLILTLGFAWPWVLVRNANFAFLYLSLEGVLDVSKVEQEAQTATATGEGLDSLLDLDTGFEAA